MAKMKNILASIVSEQGPGHDSAYEAISTIFLSMAQIARNISRDADANESMYKKYKNLADEGKVSKADIPVLRRKASTLKIAADQMEQRIKMIEKYLPR